MVLLIYSHFPRVLHTLGIVRLSVKALAAVLQPINVNACICMYIQYIHTYIRYSPTTTSHTHYTSRVVHVCFSVDREIITRVPTNSHACKTHVIPTRAVLTRVPYIFCSLIGVRVKTSNTVLCYKCFSSRLIKSIVIEEFVSAAGYSHA